MKASELRGRRWWLEDEPHDCVTALADHLREKSSARHDADCRHYRLYAGAKALGLRPSQYARTVPYAERVAWNVVAACIDTYVAKMLRSTPAPMFLTNGADWKTGRKAKRLNAFGRGALHQSGAYRVSPVIERDAAIFGTSPLHVFSESKRLCSERVFPWELLVDDTEAMYGEPRTLIREKFVDRAVALEKWGKTDELRDAITRAPAADANAIGRDSASDQITIRQAWHLPSVEGGKDGRTAICIPNATLHADSWARSRFPFAFRRYADPVAGFWGIGIAERLTGIQLEINKLLTRIQGAHHFHGRPIVILDETSGIPKSHITNDLATILVSNRAGGNPVQVVASPTMPPDVYQHLMTLRAQAFEEIGISQLDAAAKKPAGLDSRVALREYNDIGSERFLLQGKRREDWHMDVVRASLDEVRELDGFSIDVPDRRNPETVEWKDVNLDDTAYVLQCFPTSALPQQPAARMQALQEHLESGLITREQFFDMSDAPDLDSLRDEMNAPTDAIRSRIDKILDGEDPGVPESYDALSLIPSMGTAVYLRERERGAPEEILETLRQYINQAAALIAQAQAAQAAQAAAPMGAGSPAAMPAEMPAMSGGEALAAMPPMGAAA
jgi:hypothetical protein